jgi:hypothetical protein
MSTTTNFKRIALVAVAALGLGVLSSVPSQAAVTGTIVVTNTNGTASTTLADSTTAGSLKVRWLSTVSGDSVVIQTSLNSQPAAGGSPTLRYFAKDTLTSVATTTLSPGLTGLASNSDTASIVGGATGYVSATFLYQLSTTSGIKEGTYTFTTTITPWNGATGIEATKVVTQDVSIVVTAPASASTTAAPGFSVARLLTQTGTAAADSITAEAASVSLLGTAASAASASVFVRLLNAAGTADQMTLDSLTVTIDKGNLATTAGTPLGKSIIVDYAPAQGGTAGGVKFFISPDGTTGPATITIATKNAGTFTKTLNWYSAAAKTITATVAAPLLRVGTNDKAVRGVAVDANGTAWTGQAYIVASSAADALIAGSTTPVACTYSATDARHDCNVAGNAAGTAKFKIIDTAKVADATATSNEITVTVSTALATSVKIEFDKATYAPNERARIYVTPLSAAGTPIQSATYTDIFTSTGIAINGSVSFAGLTTTAESFTASTLTSARNFTTASIASSTSGARAGSQVFTVYMPSSGGTVTLTATGGSVLPLAGQVALTASATVTDSGAAALAEVTKLATTVASLRTLIVTLTNLVLKIQKKVRA